MTWRSFTAVVVAACCIGVTNCPAADNKPEKDSTAKDSGGSSIQYLPMDAPAGMSKAVVVQGFPLVHTRQLYPVDRDGKIVGEGAVDKQIEQVLNNLDAVLKASGSGLNKLVRVNICALAQPTVERTRELLAKRLDASVRPAITSVLTPLGHRKALVAVDAVATAAERGKDVALQRCEDVGGDKECADAAVLPRGGVAYFSGRPDEGGLTDSAFKRSMSWLLKTVDTLKLKPANVVQVRVFLRPAVAADDVTREMKKLFPGQLLPPVVFVEWLASMPVEIELITSLPIPGKPAPTVELYNPPDTSPNNVFSRVALVRTERQIYTSSLFSREAGKGEPQCLNVFEQLKAILKETESDMVHLAKATYFTSNDDGSRGYDLARPRLLDSSRPPAASKVMVFGVGPEGRSLSLDMIAVGVKR